MFDFADSNHALSLVAFAVIFLSYYRTMSMES